MPVDYSTSIPSNALGQRVCREGTRARNTFFLLKPGALRSDRVAARAAARSRPCDFALIEA